MTALHNMPLAVLACLSALVASDAAAQVTDVEAFAGRPFGVGRITVAVQPHRRDEPFIPLVDDRFALREGDRRALYPVMDRTPVKRFIRNLLEIEGPGRVTVYFLFRGDEPLDLALFTPEPYSTTVRPARVLNRRGERQRNRLLTKWWNEYTGEIRRLEKTSEYPVLVENYLAANLARRMNLRLPRRMRAEDSRGELQRAVRLMVGAESISAALQQQTLLGDGLGGVANQPLPEPVAVPSLPVPEVDPDGKLEALASHVPEECFYVRFGNFNNYLWLRQFLDRWGGDLRNMVNLRGVDHRINEKIQRQIALKETALAKVLGPTVIADVAMIGNDFFLKEGASFGMLFQARNNFALSSDFNSKRQAVLEAEPDARMEKMEIAGREVSFLHTPDNRIRSFYAIDDEFHLVTTSRALVERFFEAGEGKRSLAGSPKFRYARTVRPLELDDTVFVYLSDAFFQQFTGPHYRVEMTRRAQSIAEMQLLRLARWTARAEGVEAHTIDQLVAAGLLPRRFGQRPDGSRIVTKDDELLDSRRGARGAFLPISDMHVEAVTPGEVEAYHRFAQNYRAEWGALDPVIAGIQRRQLNDSGLERMVIDVQAAPYARSHYEPFINFVGQPTRRAMGIIKGDVVSLQVRTSGQGLLGLPASGTGNHLFAGIRDFRPPLLVQDNQVLPGQRRWELLRGYIGAWPKPGILGILFGTNAPAPDDQGYAQVQGFGLQGWQRSWDEFMLLSFKRDVIERVAPQVRVVEAERPAQVRFRISDLSGRQLAKAANAFGYMRARQTSVSGARLMNALADQLKVPPPESREVAEDLLDAKLQCALAGTYTLVEYPSGFQAWTSTALPKENQFLLNRVPDDYQFPLTVWFRGLKAELTVDDVSLAAHTELDLQLEPVEEVESGGFQFPSLRGFGFGGDKKQPSEDDPFAPEKKAEELPAPKPGGKPQPKGEPDDDNSPF